MSISLRSMNSAKRNCDGKAPESLPYFSEAMHSDKRWILRNGKWRPRKDGWKLSEETKEKMRKARKAIMDLHFEVMDTIATPYGSLIQTTLMLNGEKWTDGEWHKRMSKGKFPFLDDEEFIKKTLEAVGLSFDMIEGKPLAMCVSDLNTIFCPYIVDEGEVVLCSLFKDGHFLRTQETALANDSYRIVDWDEEGEAE